MWRSSGIGLACMLLVAVDAGAQRRTSGTLAPGERVRLQLVGAQDWVKGDVAHTSPDSLALLVNRNRDIRAFRWDTLRTLQVPGSLSRTRGAKNGAIAGGIVGGIAGGLLGAFAAGLGRATCDVLIMDCPRSPTNLGGFAIGFAYGILSGTAVGGLIGASIGVRQWDDVTIDRAVKPVVSRLQ